MKKFSLGDFWPMLFGSVVSVGLIWFPFWFLAEYPIDSVAEVVGTAVLFLIFVPVGIQGIWIVAGVVAAALLEYFWWGHLKEGMRKEDVLHILGEPTWKDEDYTNVSGYRESLWGYRYRWVRLRGHVKFGANDMIIWIQLPEQKP